MALDKEILDLIKRLKELNVPTQEFEKILNDANTSAEEINRTISVMKTALAGARAESVGLDNDLQSVVASLQEMTVEFGKQDSYTNTAKKGVRSLINETRKLFYEQQSGNALSVRELESIDKKIQSQRELVELAADKLAEEKKLGDLSIDEIQKNTKLEDDEKELLSLRADGYAKLEEAIKTSEKRLKLEKDVAAAAGLTLGAFQVMEKTLGKLGMSGLSQEFSDLAKDIKDNVRKQIKAAGDDANTLAIKMNAFGKGLAGAGKIVGKALFDPLTLTTAIVDKFFELDKLNTNFVNMTGQNVSYANAISTRFASAADIMEMMVEFTKETGLNAQAVFSEDDLARMAEAKNLLGLSNKEAAQLGTLSKVSGMNIEQSKEAIVAATNEFNAQNDAAVAHGVVLKDVLNTSDGIALSFGGSTEAIAGAASAARSLGMTLEQVDRIADSLMNFETSIEKELEAQLLTGNQINLSKARELALNNDLEGLSKELAANGASAAEFANMNRIQQQALADSLGMSRDELAKMLIAQEQQANLTDEQRAKMRGVTVEQLQQMEASESLKKAFSKFAEPLAKMLTALTPIVNVIAKIVSAIAPIGGVLLPVIMTVKALGGSFAGVAASIGGIAKSAKSMGKNLYSAFSNPGDKLAELKKKYKDFSNIIRGAVTGKVKSKAGDLYDTASPQGKMILTKGGTRENPLESVKDAISGDKTKKVSEGMKDVSEGAGAVDSNIGPSLGDKIKDFFTGLSAGLKEMASTKVLGGAFTALLSAPGLIALGLAAPGLAILSMIPGKGIESALSGLGRGLAAFGNALMGPQLLGLALGLGILTAAIIGIGFAIGLAAPAIEAIGTVMTAVFAGIATLVTAVAEGFVLMFSSVAENIGALLLMGPALLGIAAGLAMVSMAGFGALPILGALAGLAVVATPLIALGASLFGDGGDGGEGDSELGEKLDKILAAIERGGDVILDGTKVGEALTLGSYKL